LSVPKRRRADAQRSKAAILSAGVQVLNERPDATLDVIASAAGVTRQTVYAHFPSREDLVAAVVARITAEVVSAMDATDLDEGSAVDALFDLLEASRETVEQYPGLLQIAAGVEADHQPVAERLKRVVQRGQQTGEFDREIDADWLVAAIIALGHIGGEAQTLHVAVRRVLGVSRS
jgi:AcrR family transcriptional regulator